jgi:hypothetical protein
VTTVIAAILRRSDTVALDCGPQEALHQLVHVNYRGHCVSVTLTAAQICEAILQLSVRATERDPLVRPSRCRLVTTGRIAVVAIHIGTSGWSYAHWTNVLYPAGLRGPGLRSPGLIRFRTDDFPAVIAKLERFGLAELASCGDTRREMRAGQPLRDFS